MMITVWSAAIVVFLIIEAVTVGIASIWFALGSICALLAALLGAPTWLQIVWFAVISVLTLIITRPIVKKYVHAKAQPTNADRVIGCPAVVTEEINNLEGRGCVKIGGKEWSARSADDKPIPSDAVVKVIRIEGVKLIVAAI